MSLPIRPAPTGDAPPPQRHRTSVHSSAFIDPPNFEREVDVAFTFPHLLSMLGFPLRAARRHLRAGVVVFLGTVAAASVAAITLPRTYVIQTRMLAQRNVVMPALDNPQRAIPSESDAPTRLASEVVLSHDNLVAIIDQTNLLASWSSIVSPLGRAKMALLGLYRGPMTRQERVEALVSMLQSRLWVTTSDPGGHDGPITIGVQWPDPRSGLRIVQAAQQNFIEERHGTELSLIAESIRIIENHVEEARQQIDEASESIRRAAGPRIAPSSLAGLGGASAPARSASDQATIRSLQASLAAKRATIADLEETRTRRLAALQTQLAELRSTYGPAHPEVVSTEESIRALSTASPQLASLHADERDLVARLAAMKAPDAALPPGASADPALTRAALERIALGRPDTLEDPNVTYAKSRLKTAVANYEDLLGRLESARIEMETARAAFKYRYSTVRPPTAPTAPVKPRVPLLLAGGVFAGVVLAVFAALALDVLGGRVLEPWQIERQLHLPLLDTGNRS